LRMRFAFDLTRRLPLPAYGAPKLPGLAQIWLEGRQ
jgi:hypothetical protein